MPSRDQTLGELLRFVLFAFGATAVFHGSLVVFRLGFSMAPSPSLYLYMAGLAMPSLAAILLTGGGARRAFLRSTLAPRGSPGIYAVAILAQAGLVMLAWLLLRLSGTASRPGLEADSGLVLLAAGQLWVVFGEELGWRGFALPRLESLLTPRQATLVLALIWGVWHTPMFFVVDSFQARASPWLFAASIFAWSTIHTTLHHRSRPGVLPNLVFHACANITLSLAIIPVEFELSLLASYLLVGVLVLTTLGRPRTAFPRERDTVG